MSKKHSTAKTTTQATAKQTTTITDLPPTSAQAEQVKGGPTPKSQRIVITQSDFSGGASSAPGTDS